ncbi:MAG: DEAD/DEAH box helicase [Methanobacteriaceae archaeon]|nr:DEAD/DEAH box helicase [Methanobacteriaceae archaeon]
MNEIDPTIKEIINRCYPYIKEFNPAQKAVIETGYLESKDNYIITIPTASGKTILGILAALKTLLNNGKIIYAVPLISLQNEKYKEFKIFEQYGFKVGKHPRNCDIAVMVFESFDALTRHSLNSTQDINLIIIDEFHMIGDYSRGPTIECAITRIKKMNKGTRLIALSATLQNIDEIAQWLNAKTVTHDYRPIPLHKEIISAEEYNTSNKNDVIVHFLKKSIEESTQMLTFVSTRRFTETLADYTAKKIKNKIPPEKKEIYKEIATKILEIPQNSGSQPTQVCFNLAKCIENGIAFHHAGLFDKQKQLIEEEFKKGNLLMITATPSLMYGVNLPSKNVIIRDYTRWTDQGQINIPVFDYEQMSGRAGRPGYDTEGNSYILSKTIDESMYLDEYYIHGEIEITNSKLIDNEDALLRQIITQISSNQANNIETLIDFFNETFYGYQIAHPFNNMGLGLSDEMIKYEISNAVEYLIHNQIIRVTPSGLQTTPLGQLISKNNYGIKTAILLKEYHNISEEFKPAQLIYTICKTKDMPLINIKFRKNKEHIQERLNEEEIYTSQITNKEATAASLLEWIDERKENEIENYLNVYAASTRRAAYEASNLIRFYHEMSETLGDFKNMDQIESLKSRLYYGIKEDLIPIVTSIKRLGRQKSRKLVDLFGTNLNNISKEELMKVDGIGDKLADNIVNHYQK